MIYEKILNSYGEKNEKTCDKVLQCRRNILEVSNIFNSRIYIIGRIWVMDRTDWERDCHQEYT